jgi:two-component system phosphate regulon sensor histidine kinase PhoR
MKKKNITTIGLMCSSMFLLVLLQFFWIQSAYKNAEDDFRKETNTIFRNTIFTMQDSLIQRGLKPVGPDSLLTKMFVKRKGLRVNETITMRSDETDTAKGYINITEKSARIEIFTSDKNDSISRILRPLVTKMQRSKEPRSFVFRFGSDSLDRDSIKFYFAKALDKAGIDAKFKVVNIKEPKRPPEDEPLRIPHGKFVSEIIPFSPMNHYAVSFAAAPILLWKEITPQLLFSIFLTLLTGVSFFAMYKNLRAQQRLMAIKNDFISNVTHELKTPVATVSVALEALKNFNALRDPQKTKEYLDIAQTELNRLTLMTDKILKTSVYEDQGINLKYETLNIDQLVDEVLSSMKLIFDKKQTQWRFEKIGADFVIDGSEEHLTNVLYNLVDNALKYSGENSRLTVALESRPEKIILNVQDSGIGIAKEYQDKIFDKFFRVPSGDVHNNKGYGLGLSYVASVVESHHGKISVESEIGQGSNFSISLPRKRK